MRAIQLANAEDPSQEEMKTLLLHAKQKDIPLDEFKKISQQVENDIKHKEKITAVAERTGMPLGEVFQILKQSERNIDKSVLNPEASSVSGSVSGSVSEASTTEFNSILQSPSDIDTKSQSTMESLDQDAMIEDYLVRKFTAPVGSTPEEIRKLNMFHLMQRAMLIVDSDNPSEEKMKDIICEAKRIGMPCDDLISIFQRTNCVEETREMTHSIVQGDCPHHEESENHHTFQKESQQISENVIVPVTVPVDHGTGVSVVTLPSVEDAARNDDRELNALSPSLSYIKSNDSTVPCSNMHPDENSLVEDTMGPGNTGDFQKEEIDGVGRIANGDDSSSVSARVEADPEPVAMNRAPTYDEANLCSISKSFSSIDTKKSFGSMSNINQDDLIEKFLAR
eukprot:2634042-Ditylum_brightwellii.AAC.1